MSENLLRFSSISKKVFIALAGLFLIVFLPVHLGINLLLLPFIRPDEGAWFNEAAHFMGNNRIVKVFEIVLFATFLFHIVLAVIVQLQNWFARPKRYKIEGYSQTSFFSKFMIHTGVIIGIFLGIHLCNFYFVKMGWVAMPEGVSDKHDFYIMAQNLFSNAGYSIAYLVFMVFLAFHLSHAFQSAFQTLGLNHSRYTPAIKSIGLCYAIIIPLGFAIIPVYFFLAR